MRTFWLAFLTLAVVLAAAVSAAAQGWCYSDFAAGNIVLGSTHVAQPLSGAAVTVCTSAGTGIPCTPKASIFSDVPLTVVEANPITADSNGNFTFCAAQGTYIITIQESGFTSYSYKIALPTPAIGPCSGTWPYGEFCATPQAPSGSAVGLVAFQSTPFLTCVSCTMTYTFTVRTAGDTLLIAPPAAGDSIGVVPPSPCTDGAATFTQVNTSPQSSGFQFEKNVTAGVHTIVCGVNGNIGHQTAVLFTYELANFGSVDNAVDHQDGSGNVSSVTQSITTGSANEGIIVLASCGDQGTACSSKLTFNPTLTDLVFSTAAYQVLDGGSLAPATTASSGMFGEATAGTFTETVNVSPATPSFTQVGISMIAIVPANPTFTGTLAPRPISPSDLPGGGGAQLMGTTRNVLSGNTSITTAATLITINLTMPAAGCPCRVLASYSVATSALGSGSWYAWVSDATNNFAEFGGFVTTAATAPVMVNTEVSPVAYINGQAVTFTLHAQGNGSALATPAVPASGAESSYMTLTILPSAN